MYKMFSSSSLTNSRHLDLFITGLNCVLPEERSLLSLVPSVAWYLEEGMATHSILAWRIHGEKEPVGLQSHGHKESDMPM